MLLSVLLFFDFYDVLLIIFNIKTNTIMVMGCFQSYSTKL